jgi:hypothetical protein
MGDYRAYILGIDGHRFIKAKDFLSTHRDDAAAMKAAKQLLDGHDVELWDCGRLVARLAPNGEVMSPELAPFTISATPSDGESNSDKAPIESISLSRVSRAPERASEENHLLLGW